MSDSNLSPSFSDAVFRDHAGLVASASVVALAGLSVLVFTRGSAEVAQVVIQEQGPGTIVLGAVLQMIISFVPSLLTAASALPVLQVLGLVPRLPSAWAWLVGVPSLAVVAVALPIAVLVFVPVSVVAFYLLAKFPRSRRDGLVGRRVSGGGRTLFFGSAFLFLFIASVIYDPWLPRESVVVGGRDPAAAFVLSSNDIETVLVSSTGTEVRRLPTEDIESRSLCGRKNDLGIWGKPAFGLFGFERSIFFSGGYDLPVCPDRHLD